MTAITVPAVTQIYPAACYLALNAKGQQQPAEAQNTRDEVERYRGLLVK